MYRERYIYIYIYICILGGLVGLHAQGREGPGELLVVERRVELLRASLVILTLIVMLIVHLRNSC